jgi:hypothetical protein
MTKPRIRDAIATRTAPPKVDRAQEPDMFAGPPGKAGRRRRQRRRARRSPTVTIHKTGLVTYYSQLRCVLTTCLPEHVDPVDLARMSTRNRDRLVSRFGTTKNGSAGPPWLMSAAQRRAGTERETA